MKIDVKIKRMGDNHLDSLWYESGKDIAMLTHKNRKVVVCCNGQVKLVLQKDGKPYVKFDNAYINGNMIDFKYHVFGDKHIKRLLDEEKLELTNNNWFEVMTQVDDQPWKELDNVYHDYDIVMKFAKKYIKKDENWKKEPQ